MTDLDIDLMALATVFGAESRELLDQIEEAAIALEEHPEDGEAIRTLFRGAHTLKGNASCLGLDKISRAAHQLEDVLDLLRSNRARADSGLITLILGVVDLFREALPAATEMRDEVPDWTDEMLAALSAWAASQSSTLAEEAQQRRGTAATKAGALRRGMRVDLDRLDLMMNLTGEMAIARGRLAGEMERNGVIGSLLDAFSETERLAQQLQEMVTSLRLVPVGVVFRPLVRTARDLAASEGKKVRVTMEGADVEVDLSVIEHLRDPLVHMVRNAVDHGIEACEVRTARGKSAEGRISISARHETGHIAISVEDDGRGFDREAIAARGREIGIDVDELGQRDVLRLLFEPGFTTSRAVTDVSGRGVGLDVVRRGVEALRGSIEVEDRAGGARFTLRVPLTLAIIEGFGVSVGGEAYIIPLASLLECLDAGDLAMHGTATAVIDVRGEALPVIDLASCVGARTGAVKHHVVVVQSPCGRAGLAVDSLEGLHQSVIKPLGRPFGRVRNFSGSTILGDGRVALVLDVPTLVEKAARESRTR